MAKDTMEGVKEKGDMEGKGFQRREIVAIG